MEINPIKLLLLVMLVLFIFNCPNILEGLENDKKKLKNKIKKMKLKKKEMKAEAKKKKKKLKEKKKKRELRERELKRRES